MEEIPAGTITMLFSDIEGSTALLSRLGDQYGEALSAQRALLRGCFAEFGGHEMGTEGDSFFVVFRSAGDAVSCCLAGQRALAGHDWPGGVAVRVRMGLHSGEPTRHEDGYIGLAVHRAARIAAAAHGGQVVLSDATRVLAATRLPAGVSVRDLGLHRLKDIEAPERIYQLVAPGLAKEFPPLKSLGAQTSLPTPMTPLVGREGELEWLWAKVAQPGIRLVTLTGPGGVGKTRLALAVAASLADAFAHGVFFVALAAVRDADIMWKTLADSLNVSGDGPASDTVTGYLRERRALLVLDNLEQLDGAAAVVATLLGCAPGVVTLATSRRPLHIQGEQEHPVPPLEIARDADVGAVAACAAARLFVQQAVMVRPGFALTEDNAADIAAICARLDGLPLAIELAASRAKLLAPRALLARLGQSLALPAADAGRPVRQQTLRNTVAWSYDLLAPEVAAVFRRMSVFAGGCDLDALAAVAVTGQVQEARADPLQLAADLLDVSMITVTEGSDGEPRIGMLETIRQYALERLKGAGDLDDAQRLHAQYYAALAERTQRQLGGPADLDALDRLEAEHDNLRAALAWALEPEAGDPADVSGRVATGLRLVQALGQFWNTHGHATEGRRWLQRAIELVNDDGGAPVARIAHWLARALLQLGELDAAASLFERSLAIWRNLGEHDEQARELYCLGGTHRRRGDLDTARSVLAESAAISRQIGSEARLASALMNLGQAECVAGNLERGAELLQEALGLHRKLSDIEDSAIDLQTLSLISLLLGRASEARDLQAGTFEYVASSGDTEFILDVMELSACIAAELGECQRAARLAGAADALRQLAGMPMSEYDAVVLERYLAPARETLATEGWRAEFAVGRALSQQEAVKLLTSSAGGHLTDPNVPALVPLPAAAEQPKGL